MSNNNENSSTAAAAPSTDKKQPSSDLSPDQITEHPGPIHHSPKQAHHITEFGEVDKLVHIKTRRITEDDALPPPPIDRKDKLAVRERLTRLKNKCFHARHVHQYWQGDTLFRSAGKRSIGSDELFLDLVIVGGIAALGHELRESFQGWEEVQKFLILFGALISSWRAVVFLWNVWGVCSDLTDKIGIYLVFTCLTFISLGAHGAFTDHVRVYVGIASFLATALPSVTNMYWSYKEPLIRTKGYMSPLSFYCLMSIIFVIPYLAAAFVTKERHAKILFWTSLVTNSVAFLFISRIYRTLVKSHHKLTNIAVNIELFVEKYDVLTMIVIGESVLGILFEGATVVTKEGVRLGHLFGATTMSAAMLYALQTLYNNIDSPIAKGGKHAIRHNRVSGGAWSLLHIPYHAALIIFATGLGISIRDIAIEPNTKSAERMILFNQLVKSGVDETVLDQLVKAGGSEESCLGSEEGCFDIKARWLFSVGWGASIILSGLIGSLHLAGPRAATKKWRFFIRSFIVIAATTGLPFAKDLAADTFICIYSSILIAIAIFEYVFVQMDKMGFFRSEATMFSSSTNATDEKNGASFDDDDDDDDEDEDSSADDVRMNNFELNDNMDGIQLNRLGGSSADVENNMSNENMNALVRRRTRRERIESEMNQIQAPELEDIEDEEARRRLKERMCRSHKMRLVAASKKKCEQLKDNALDLG